MSANGKLILALVKDLFFGARLSDVAAALGYAFKRVSTGTALLDALDGQAPALVIVDLGVKPCDLAEVARKAGGARLIAFGPHVDTESRAAARSAGFHEVVANSRLARELPQLLSRNLEGHHELTPDDAASAES